MQKKQKTEKNTRACPEARGIVLVSVGFQEESTHSFVLVRLFSTPSQAVHVDDSSIYSTIGMH